LLKLAERTLREECGLQRGDRILVAVSGGPDSMALLHVLSRLAPRLGIELVAHGVDHGLRPEAGAELDLAERWARAANLRFDRTRVRVEAGGNLQARARRARFDALERAARAAGGALIATAHHADDRAETVMMRLLRGSGPRGLAVLPPRSGSLIRPIIRARRADILAHLARHRIEHALDPSNQDRRYLRVRVRLELMPMLEALSPRIVWHLTALADQIGDEGPPLVLDEAGEPLPMSRAHVDQLRRAQRLGLVGARVRLPGGRELRIDPRTREPVLGGPRRSGRGPRKDGRTGGDGESPGGG
jgi:tRNA(Ile)-lysidine synthase